MPHLFGKVPAERANQEDDDQTQISEQAFPRCCKPGGSSSRWRERGVRAWGDEVMGTRSAA